MLTCQSVKVWRWLTLPAIGVQKTGCTPSLIQALTVCKTALPADDYNYKYFAFQIVLAFIMYLIGGCLSRQGTLA